MHMLIYMYMHLHTHACMPAASRAAAGRGGSAAGGSSGGPPGTLGSLDPVPMLPPAALPAAALLACRDVYVDACICTVPTFYYFSKLFPSCSKSV